MMVFLQREIHEILKWMQGNSSQEGIVINPPRENKPKN